MGDADVSKFAVILPAAGRSRRFSDRSYKKVFAPLANKAIWLHSAERFLGRSDVIQTILVIAPEDRPDFMFKFSANIAILGHRGGRRRGGACRFGRGRVGAGEAAGRLHLRSRRRPALFDRRLDRPGFRGRREVGRRDFRHSRRRHAQTGRRQPQDRGDRLARGALGSANAAGLPPPAVCWTPMRSVPASKPPTKPNWSSGSAIP